jgi:hypothetical protein
MNDNLHNSMYSNNTDFEHRLASKEAELKVSNQALFEAARSRDCMVTKVKELQTLLDTKKDLIDALHKTKDDVEHRLERLLDETRQTAEATNLYLGQVNESGSNKHLESKISRLQKENAEIPKLQKRIKHADAEHEELVLLRLDIKEWKGRAQDADAMVKKVTRLENVLNNMKRENGRLKDNLKKIASEGEASRLKEELHRANVRVEQLIQQVKALEKRPLAMASGGTYDSRSIEYDTNDFAQIHENDTADDDPDHSHGNNTGLHRFNLSSTSFTREALRALHYINNLNTTVATRATNIGGAKAGMGWDAYDQLERLVGWVGREGGEAVRKVLELDGEAKVESLGFPRLPLGLGHANVAAGGNVGGGKGKGKKGKGK